MSRQQIRRVHVALALIERGDRYLVCRRPAGVHLAGYWEFPGGKRRVGETWRSCLRREVREELGVRIVRPISIGTMRYRYPDRLISFHLFRCRVGPLTYNPLHASELMWVKRSHLLRYRFPPANAGLIRQLAGLRHREGVI